MADTDNALGPLRDVTGFRELPWEFSRANGLARFVELRLSCGHTIKRSMGAKLLFGCARCPECRPARVAAASVYIPSPAQAAETTFSSSWATPRELRDELASLAAALGAEVSAREAAEAKLRAMEGRSSEG